MNRALDCYEWFLWGVVEAIGVTESIDRKMVAAVALQFQASLGLVVVMLVTSGFLQVVLIGVVFVLASVAFANTVLISRRDFVDPEVLIGPRRSDPTSETEDTDWDDIEPDTFSTIPGDNSRLIAQRDDSPNNSGRWLALHVETQVAATGNPGRRPQ